MLKFIPIALIIITATSLAQRPSDIKYGSVTGKVIDHNEKIPMEYANVILFSPSDSSSMTGTISEKDGRFSLRNIKPGTYSLVVSFMGFDDYRDEKIVVDQNRTIDIGVIELTPHSYNVGDVVIEAERAMISYEIDKKVINVSEQITSASGSAVDVLENVPSVTVDIEGNVSLRGSSNFRVLIDGRPSILEPSEILDQIPASSLENIEIVTNPSAKYDPEGTAGFINLVMKKNKRAGYSGIAEANGGLKNKYGGQLIFDYKQDTYRLSAGIDYNKRTRYSDQKDNNITTFEDNTSYRNSFGTNNHGGNRFGLKAEFEYIINDFNTFSMGARYRDRRRENEANLNFTEWSELEPARNIYNSISEGFRGGDQYSLNANYELKFASNGHNLKAEFQYESDDGEEESVNTLVDRNNMIISGQKSTEYGPGSEIRTKLDYTIELNDKSKFEAGYQNELDLSEEETGYYEYDNSTSSFNKIDRFSNDVKYNENEHSVYSLFASKLNGFGFQAGLRGEYTDRKIESMRTNQTFTIDRWDLFPSIHTSYHIDNDNQIMASYTRRIDRPGGGQLEPFETWMDAYNVRRGNPALLPEFINSFELGYQTLIGASVFSIESYYRENKNKIERIRSVYSDNITLHTMENVGTDYSFGLESMLNFDPLAGWNLNMMGNVYNYRIEGVIADEPFKRESFNWSARLVNIIKLWKSTQVQFNAIYNSPSVSSQGKREDFFYFNLALRHQIIENLLSATIQIRDVFGTSRYEYTSESKNYYNYYYRTNEAPMVMLNLKFTLNKQEQEKRETNNNSPDIEGEDDFSQ